MAGLDKASLVVLIGAAALAGLEALIDLWILKSVKLEWSIYALVPLAASSAVLRIIERRPRLKENIGATVPVVALKIRRRLFNAKEEALREPEILWNFRAAP